MLSGSLAISPFGTATVLTSGIAVRLFGIFGGVVIFRFFFTGHDGNGHKGRRGLAAVGCDKVFYRLRHGFTLAVLANVSPYLIYL